MNGFINKSRYWREKDRFSERERDREKERKKEDRKRERERWRGWGERKIYEEYNTLFP